MSDLKTPWSVHVDHQTSPGRFDVFSSEGYLVAAATTRERADLICASPELLEALQAVMFDVMANRAAINDDRIDEIRAAISKALGG